MGRKTKYTSNENLKLYLLGGSFHKSIDELSRLYHERGEDLKLTSATTTTIQINRGKRAYSKSKLDR